MFRILVLLFGQILSASSVIMIKAARLDAALLSASRLLLAALILLPVYLSRPRVYVAEKRRIHPSILPGIALGLHLWTWNLGARMTAAVNATLIVNLVPLVMPFLIFAMIREKPRAYEIGGTVLTLGGLAFLTLGGLGSGSAAGDLICFVSMVLLTVYMALARKNAGSIGLWEYIVPLYAVAGIVSLLIAGTEAAFDGFGNGGLPPRFIPTGLDLLCVLGLAVLCTIGGHSISNWAMRIFPSQFVSLASCTQFIWSGIMAFVIFGERPESNFYPAMGLILVGCALAIVPGLLKTPRQ